MTAAAITNTLLIKGKEGEEVIYRKDVRKGWTRKKTISAYLITNNRVISPEGTELWLNEIDDVVSINNIRDNRGGFTAIGTRGPMRYYMGQTQSKSRGIGDLIFMSANKPDLRWYGMEDPQNLIKLVGSLKKQGALEKQLQKQQRVGAKKGEGQFKSDSLYK
jgi:hypothetical protein